MKPGKRNLAFFRTLALALALALVLSLSLSLSWPSARAQEALSYAYTLEEATRTLWIQEGVVDLPWGSPDLAVSPEVVCLPASLRTMDPYALRSFEEVREYRVAEGNPAFQASEGVLYTGDGSTLLAFPPQKGGSYALPQGTTEIAQGAFWGNTVLEELTLPQGMERFPPGLLDWEGGPAPYPRLRRLVFSATIREASGSLLPCTTLEEIRVPPDNPYFYDLEGVLFHRDGTLVAYPLGKTALHYDVPTGTLAIGDSAFRYHGFLRSISLPQGLKTIGRSAFSRSAYLEAVSLPLTVESIGEYAFGNCVHLAQIAPAAGVRLGERAFENCPLLGLPPSGDLPPTQEWSPRTLRALANPENSRDRVTVLSEPRAGADVIGTLECGWYLEVTEQKGDFYKVVFHFPNNDGGTEGYVPVGQVQLVDYLQGLFTLVQAAPLPGKEGIPRFGYPSVPAGEKGVWLPLEGGRTRPVWRQSGQSLELVMEGGGYSYAKVSDATLYAQEIPQGKRYGLVISPDTRDRLHLRAAPRKGGESLGKFFSGTQVEILGEEGDWFQVRVGFEEGYMMKEFVREVKEWKEP